MGTTVPAGTVPCAGCARRTLCGLCGDSCRDYDDWFGGWFHGAWALLRQVLGRREHG